ncbi:hypothetical protein [Oceanobacillus sp. FSL W7-1281]|uniref:hypothetical protein n=1 Tax=Oceanobacillus sp. FSL W7-1281 TaxID=2921698 RepID=UPI0030D8AEC9
MSGAGYVLEKNNSTGKWNEILPEYSGVKIKYNTNYELEGKIEASHPKLIEYLKTIPNEPLRVNLVDSGAVIGVDDYNHVYEINNWRIEGMFIVGNISLLIKEKED